MHVSTLPLPRKKPVVGVFPTNMKGGTMINKCVLVQAITFVLSDPQQGTLSCQHLDSGMTEISILKSPSTGCMFNSSPSLSRDNLGVGSFLLIMPC